MKAKNQRDWLLVLRAHLGGISSATLGARVGVSRMTSHRWHNPETADRHSTPSLVHAIRLAKLAETTVEAVGRVFHRKDSPDQPPTLAQAVKIARFSGRPLEDVIKYWKVKG